MRIAIIAEGRSDLIVVENILLGIVGLDSKDIEFLRPESGYDATHLAMMNQNNKSTWTLVKEECVSKDKIKKFFQLEGNDFIAIHIDAAERDEYEIEGLQNNQDCLAIRNIIANKIDEWLNHEHTDQILHAVAVEETEAWLLTIYDNGKDSCQWDDPKKYLEKLLSRKGINTTRSYDNYFELSKDFKRKRNWRKDSYVKYNTSLNAFVEEVITKLHLQ